MQQEVSLSEGGRVVEISFPTVKMRDENTGEKTREEGFSFCITSKGRGRDKRNG